MSTSNTICVSQEGPANALALNKDSTQVVIAGRNGKQLILFTYIPVFLTEKLPHDQINLIYNICCSIQSVRDRRERVHGNVQLASRQKLKPELLFDRCRMEWNRGKHTSHGGHQRRGCRLEPWSFRSL